MLIVEKLRIFVKRIVCSNFKIRIVKGLVICVVVRATVLVLRRERRQAASTYAALCALLHQDDGKFESRQQNLH